MKFVMKGFAPAAIPILAGVMASIAWGGHELPVYPSYYPHEIEFRSLDSQQAGALLTDAKIQAYIGGIPKFSGRPPDFVQPIESLGSFVVVRANPRASATRESFCGIVTAI